MKKIFLTVVISFFLTSVVYGQESKQSIQLIIKSDKQVYEMGEDIELAVNIVNNSDKEQILIWGPSYRPRSEEAGVFIIQVPSFDDEFFMRKTLHIQPKESVSEKVVSRIDNYEGKAGVQLLYEYTGILDFKTSPQQELCLGPILSDIISIELVKKIDVGQNWANIQWGPSNNNLELKNGYEYGPAETGPSIAFNLANEFIQRQKDIKRFLITKPSVSSINGMNDLYEVRYKLLTKSEESEAVVRVDIKNKTCKRIK
ncbi:MAG: hypothetical protein ABH890_06410 [Bacillota bacterium]